MLHYERVMEAIRLIKEMGVEKSDIVQEKPKEVVKEEPKPVEKKQDDEFLDIPKPTTSIGGIKPNTDFENTSEPVYTKPIAPTPKPQPAPVVKEKPKTKPKKVEPKSDDQQTSMF